MASLSLSHIYKVYPNGHKAVNDFSMDIEDREFIVFVGPSGCGKSTTLRMIAGLEEITAGELRIDGEVVNDEEPKERDIAMVFQNYALYPHMTVFDNMAFGLTLRRVSKDEIKRRVNEAAKILGITEYLNKKPKEMSGGQRQRVALGRAMVREPKVFLLDEPLSNLDAKLRTQMRSEILKLHDRIKTTFIYVTHDQVEAMTMGTRIVVMKDGFVQQIDTPRNLYSYPVNKFVAGFIGTPQMNFFDGTIARNGKNISIDFDGVPVHFDVPSEKFAKIEWQYLCGNRPITFGIRSEHVSVDANKYPYKAKVKVSYCEDLGVDSQVYADFDLEREDGVLDSSTKIIIKAPAATMIEKGSVIDISLDLDNLQMFDGVTEQTIMPRVPQKTAFNATVSGGKLKILGVEKVLPDAIKLQDGEYVVEAESGAISFGGNIKIELCGSEEVGDRLITKVTNGDDIFYVVTNKNEKPQKKIDVDLKRCSFLVSLDESEREKLKAEHESEIEKEQKESEEKAQQKEKGVRKFTAIFKKLFRKKKKNAEEKTEQKVQPFVPPTHRIIVEKLPMENTLNCSFKRFVEVENITVDGEQKQSKVKKYSLSFANPDVGVEVDALEKKSKKLPVPTYDIKLDGVSAQKILNGAGRLVYKDELSVVFSPYDVKIASDGINGTIEGIVDYGNERFYEVCVSGKIVRIFVNDGDNFAVGDVVKIVPDVEKIKVFDDTIDIRLV